MKKLLVVLMCIFIGGSIIACGTKDDARFRNTFVKAMNDRWDAQNSLEKKREEAKNSQYNVIIENEYNAISKFKDKDFSNKSIKQLFIEYLDILEEQKAYVKSELKNENNLMQDPANEEFEMKKMNVIKKLYLEYRFNFDKEKYELYSTKYDENK